MPGQKRASREILPTRIFPIPLPRHPLHHRWGAGGLPARCRRHGRADRREFWERIAAFWITPLIVAGLLVLTAFRSISEIVPLGAPTAFSVMRATGSACSPWILWATTVPQYLVMASVVSFLPHGLPLPGA